jgi:HSP20 family molecular chaperone IbpA
MAYFTPYPPDMYFTTYLHQSFPEHHYPFEVTRHKMGNFIKSFQSEVPWQVPRADVSETKDAFFIDVELPGLENTEKLKLKWTNSRTLLVDADLDKPALLTTGSSTTTEAEEQGAKPINPDKEYTNNAPAIHVTVHERWHGHVVRAFFFPVDVDHSAIKTQLKAGVLRLMVPKTGETKDVKNEIKVA